MSVRTLLHCLAYTSSLESRHQSLNGTVWQDIDLWIDRALQLRAEAAGEVVARTGRGGAEPRRQ
jgi:hypothetical protein